MFLWPRLGFAPSFRRWWPVLLLILGLAGCGRNEIHVYSIPKEKDAQTAWKLPSGWEERPADGMRVARFAAPGKNGQEPDVAIFPLKALSGRRADVVNLWRGQIHLPAVEAEALDKLADKVSVGSTPGDLYDMVSAEPLPDNKAKSRILVAAVDTENTTWIVKMSGDDESVQQQKPAFLSFLQSLNFEALAAQPQAPTRFTSTNVKQVPRTASEAKPQWIVPPGWKEQPPSQMLLAKFLIPGENGTKAEVNISVSDGDGGGVLNNVSRWRNQIKLPIVEEAELEKLTTTLDVPGGKAILVDMSGTDAKTGQPARLIGAIVAIDGKTWFYKLMGNEQIAAREKDAFVEFFKSAKYPNG